MYISADKIQFCFFFRVIFSILERKLELQIIYCYCISTVPFFFWHCFSISQLISINRFGQNCACKHCKLLILNKYYFSYIHTSKNRSSKFFYWMYKKKKNFCFCYLFVNYCHSIIIPPPSTLRQYQKNYIFSALAIIQHYIGLLRKQKKKLIYRWKLSNFRKDKKIFLFTNKQKRLTART